MRCSSVQKSATGRPWLRASSSARVSANFFEGGPFLGIGRGRVLRTRYLDRPADRLERVPGPLRIDRGQPELARHEGRDLGRVPHPAIRGQALQARTQLVQKLRCQKPGGRAVAPPAIPQRIGAELIAALGQLHEPAHSHGRAQGRYSGAPWPDHDLLQQLRPLVRARHRGPASGRRVGGLRRRLQMIDATSVRVHQRGTPWTETKPLPNGC